MTARRLLLDARSLGEALDSLGAAGVLPAELTEPDGVAAEPLAQHPAVLAALGLLVAPGLPRVLVRAGSSYRRRLTLLAAGGGLGASLARDVDGPEADRPVEHSAFPDAGLPAEIARCLPELPLAPAPRKPVRGVDPALLLAAGSAEDLVLARHGGWRDERAVAGLSGELTGSLEVTVSCAAVVGRLLWVHSEHAWWHLSPTADGSGARALDLLPVEPQDLLPALAPLLAQALALATAGAAS